MSVSCAISASAARRFKAQSKSRFSFGIVIPVHTTASAAELGSAEGGERPPDDRRKADLEARVRSPRYIQGRECL